MLRKRNHGLKIMALVGICSSSFVAATQAATPADDLAKALTAFKDVSMVAWEDGRVDIAGVVGMTKNKDGSSTIRVTPKGDFERDTVATINAYVYPGKNGDLVVAGVGAFNYDEKSDVFTFTIGDPDPVAHEGINCRIEIPYPSGDPVCRTFNGCQSSGVVCGWDVIHDDDGNAFAVCTCISDPVVPK